MTSTTTVQRRVEELRRMLTRVGVVEAQTPRARAAADVLRRLAELEREYRATHDLASWVQLDCAVAKDVARQYAATLDDYEKVWDPTTRGHRLVKKRIP